MRHRVRNIKFKYGKDSNRALTRKMVLNFITRGYMTSTEKKIKHVRRQIERIIQLAKKDTVSTRRILQRSLSDPTVEKMLKNEVAPVFKNRSSGFTSYIHLIRRESDGAAMAKLKWSLPVVIEKKIVPIKKAKSDEVKENAKSKKEVVTEKKLKKDEKK